MKTKLLLIMGSGLLALTAPQTKAEEKPGALNSRNPTPEIRSDSKTENQPAASEETDSESSPLIPEVPPPNYRVSHEDAVLISVFREPELKTVARIDEEGMIQMPLLGKVKILGLTLDEIADLIKTQLDRDYVIDPKVTASIVGYSRKQFTILGPVRVPGVYALSGSKKTDLLQALAAAGGLSRIADEGAILLQRKVNGKEKVFRLDSKAMQRGEAELFEIESGDIITVQESIF